jgi:hypothetical protein
MQYTSVMSKNFVENHIFVHVYCISKSDNCFRPTNDSAPIKNTMESKKAVYGT